MLNCCRQSAMNMTAPTWSLTAAQCSRLWPSYITSTTHEPSHAVSINHTSSLTQQDLLNSICDGLHSDVVWSQAAWLVMVESLIESSRVWVSTVSLSHKDSVQVVCTHVPLSPSSIIWYWSHDGDVLLLDRKVPTHYRLSGIPQTGWKELTAYEREMSPPITVQYGSVT